MILGQLVSSTTNKRLIHQAERYYYWYQKMAIYKIKKAWAGQAKNPLCETSNNC